MGDVVRWTTYVLRIKPFCTRSYLTCDLTEEESFNHIVMQCPALQKERDYVSYLIRNVKDGYGANFVMKGKVF